MNARNNVEQEEFGEAMAPVMVYEGRIPDDKAKQPPEPGPSTFNNNEEEANMEF